MRPGQGHHGRAELGPAIKKRCRLGVVFVLLLATPSYAWADEVLLHNGDRLTGEIVKMEDELLTLKTTYGGETTMLTLTWEEVARLRSDKPMKILLHGEPGASVLEFFSGGGTKVMATEVGSGTSIPLKEIRAINLDPIYYRGTVTIGGNNTQGNTQTKAINSAARITLRAHRQRLNLEAKYNYGEAGDTVTARNSLASGKYDFFLTKKVFLNAMSLFEKDTFQRLNLRMTFGAGVGYQFLESRRKILSAEVGLAYVNEHFTTTESQQTPSAHWALKYDHAVLPDRLSVFHKHDGYYDLAAGNAVRVLADQGVRVVVYQQLFVNLEYDLRFNSQPAPGRKQLDEAYIFGLGYQFE
jgi:putative salt-induced outer membrane protein YdiY